MFVFLILLPAHVLPAPQHTLRKYPDDRHPVTWKIRAVMHGKNKATILVTAKIAFGWHIYSSEMENVGPLPTQIRLNTDNSWSSNQPLRESGSPVQYFDSTYMIRIAWFEDSVTFSKSIRLHKNNTVLSGEITFMACKEDLCLPPERYPFKLALATPARPRKKDRP